MSEFSVNRIVYKSHCTFGPRIQRDLQLVYVYAGTMRVRVEDVEYEVRDHEATILVPGRRERFEFAYDGETAHGWCQTEHYDLPAEVIGRLEGRPRVLPFTRTMEMLDDLAYGVSVGSDPALFHYRSAVIKAILWEALAGTRCFARPETRFPPPVERAVAFIERAYGETVTNSRIAREAAVGVAHLIRLFHLHMNITPQRYLWSTRLRVACELLRDTAFTASEIAYRTGFANPHHFSRHFKEQIGESPIRYRNRLWRGDSSAGER